MSAPEAQSSGLRAQSKIENEEINVENDKLVWDKVIL
jgi:hypothetical protein